ncbi:MAG TPA: hypothetical protein VMU31_11375 [Rhizomicrobium sp.]|nr:hypothetical protein [Rhizomicrobium sp.]
MTRRIGMLAVVAALMPLTASGQGDDYGPYHALLAKECPAQHLELLSPGELDDLIEVNFHDALPGSLQTRLDTADRTEKEACANAVAGLACFNVAYLRAMSDVNLLPRFAKLVCASGLSCKGQSDCARAD